MTTTLSASSSSAALLPFLPQEILVQILSKLPAKSLVRFKCVSKFFCSLVVDDHLFADLHRNWSLTLPSRMSIFIFYPAVLQPISTADWYYTIDYSEENQGKLQANRLQYIDDDARNLFRKSLYLSSSVNGLICFGGYSLLRDDIVIHNLSTRQHIFLPSNCRVGCDPWSRMIAFGLLGFDSVSRRYKVLKSVQFTDRRYRHVSVKHWVFTLGVDKSWREIHSSPNYHPYNCFNFPIHFGTSVHIEGVIYSLNSLSNKDYRRRNDIIAFDVRTENFHVIPPHPPITRMPILVEVNGRLAIVNLISDDGSLSMKIWTLEKSMVWKNQYLIRIPIQFGENESAMFKKNILFLTSNHVGEIAVLVKLSKSVSILFYNFKRHSWRKFGICELPLSLPWSSTMHFILDNIF